MLTNVQPTTVNMRTFSCTSKITHVGNLNINGFILSSVYYSPNGKSNLISQSQLEDHGFKYFSKIQMIVIKSGKQIVKSFSRKGNVYVSKIAQPTPQINKLSSPAHHPQPD
ncbi:hypothetical protein O181_012653 [Austropuccinia psidii MF-1]|uniref:Uncharacterized protein n=1 Tax=Austropuccinia psidii MF-1 TaxID=1389203 RepID=A0A9Q3BX60_9BASI|nr:hypothetical protein [Austropuccinia psidii MF-1]